MNYDERKRIISGWLIEFLKRYEVPTHLDQNSIREEMVLMVEDINSEIPNDMNEGGLRYVLDQIGSYIRKNQTTRKWPTISLFVKGVKDSKGNVVEDHLASPINKEWDDPLVINAKRIKSGEAVGDWYIIGKGANQMLERGLVTYEELKPYQKSLEYQKKQMYREEVSSYEV